MTNRPRNNMNRRGSVYLAVLGTALIVSLLAFSALALQRLQNRMLVASADIRQAQLNAEAAIALGLLAIKQDSAWRTTYANGQWFGSRSTGDGTCTLEVIDPVDGNLADDATESIVMTGVGSAGRAVQRVVRTIDAHIEPLDCLRSSVAAGGAINLSSAVLRATSSGLISANSSSISSSTVYGKVQAVTVSGSTYSGTTAQIAAADLPAMPDWATVFSYYKTNGTEININSVPTSTPNLGRNVGIENNLVGLPNRPDWTGDPLPGIVPTAVVEQSTNYFHAGAKSVKVKNRANFWAGAAQPIDHLIQPGDQFTVDVWVYHRYNFAVSFVLTLYTKGSGSQTNDAGSAVVVWPNSWTRLTSTMTVPSWSGNLEYAFVKIGGISTGLGNTTDFYVDDLDIRRVTTGRLIYRQVLAPGVNTLGGATNAQGLYWINCVGNKLTIERSRINGTLLVVNPGAGSGIGPGPISWAPATPGYPALLVDADVAANADLTIAATNRSLSEADDDVDYNLDGNLNYIYPSEIQGLVVVEDDLAFQNSALVRGEVIAGDAITATSGSMEVVYRPDALLSPPPGFTATPSIVGRPVSIRKVVLP